MGHTFLITVTHFLLFDNEFCLKYSPELYALNIADDYGNEYIFKITVENEEDEVMFRLKFGL